MTHRRSIAGQGGGAWTPPQLDSLLAAWVSGLSGSVAQGEVWDGQYGTAAVATMTGTAIVNDDGLTSTKSDPNGATVSGVAALADLPKLSSWSVAFWVRHADNGAISVVPVSWDGTDDLIVYTNDPIGGCRVFWRNRGASVIDEDTGESLAGAWMHMALVFASGKLSAYRNGVQIAQSGAITNAAHNTTAMYLARWPDTQGLTGSMDCVYAYSDALSTESIAIIYASDPFRRGNL